MTTRRKTRKREYKAFIGAHPSLGAVDFKVIDEAKGIAEFYVSVYAVEDSMHEAVDYKAYDKSLKTKLPKGVWSHDWETTIAKTLEAEEVPAGSGKLSEKIKGYGGLRILAQFNMETQRGSEAFSDVKGGYIDEFSIGYEVVEDYVKDGVRHLKEIRLYEWSPVLVGANPMTEVVGAKALAAPLPPDEEKVEVDDGSICAFVIGTIKTDTGDDAPALCCLTESAHKDNPVVKHPFTKTVDPVSLVNATVATETVTIASPKFTDEQKTKAHALLVAEMDKKDLAEDVSAARPWNEVMLILGCFYSALDFITYAAMTVEEMRAMVAALAQDLIDMMAGTTVDATMSATQPDPTLDPADNAEPTIYQEGLTTTGRKEGRILSDQNYKRIAIARDSLAEVITIHESAMASRTPSEIDDQSEAKEVAAPKAAAKAAVLVAVDAEAEAKTLGKIESLETRLVGSVDEITRTLKRLGISTTIKH